MKKESTNKSYVKPIVNSILVSPCVILAGSGEGDGGTTEEPKDDQLNWNEKEGQGTWQ